MHYHPSAQADGDVEQMGRADCPECNGTGAVSAIVGDEQMAERCVSCGGMGYQLTRDEFANIDALRNDCPAFANHGEEVAWVLRTYRKAS